MERRGRRGLVLRVLAGTLGAAVLLAIVAWFLRDLPRRTVERALAERLGAEVELHGFEVESLHRVVLRGLVIRNLGGAAWLDHARIERLDAEGPLRAMVDGRVDALTIDGLDVVLGPPPPGPARPAGPPSTATVGRIDLRRGTLRFGGPGTRAPDTPPTVFAFEGAFTGFGTALEGRLAAEAPDLDGAAAARLAGLAWPPGLSVRLSRPRAGMQVRGTALDATLDADSLLVTRAAPAAAGSRLAIGAPRATIALTAGDASIDARVAVVLDPLADLSVVAALDRTYRPRRIAATLGALEVRDLVPWIAAFVPAARAAFGPDPEIDARLSGEIVHDAITGSWDLRAGATVRRVRIAAFGAEDAKFTATAALRAPTAPGAADGPLASLARASGPCTLALEVAHARDRRGMVPARAYPLALDASGEVTLPARRFEGSVRARTRGLGVVLVDGAFSPGALDARYAWTDVRAETLRAAAEETGLVAARSAVPTVEGALLLNGTLRGPPAAPDVAFTLRATDARVSALPAGAEVGVPAATIDGTFAGGRVTAAIDAVRTVAAADGLPDTPVALHATVDAETAPEGFLVRDLKARATSDGLFEASLEAHGTVAQGAAHLDVAGADLARWRTHLAPVLGDPLQGATVAGSVRATLDATWDAAGWTLRGPLALAGGSLFSADGARAVEGVAPTFDLLAQGGFLPPYLAHAGLRGRAGGVQALWESLFADYSEAFLDAALDVRPAAEGQGAWDLSGDITLPGSARATLAARAGGGPPSARVRLDVPRLAPFYDALARRPLGESVPVLARLSTEGALALDVAVRGGAGTGLSGHLALDRVGLRAEGLDLQGLRIEFPFDVTVARNGAVPRVEGPALEGRFAFERLVAGGFEMPPLSSRVDVAADTLALREPLVVPVSGGEVRLHTLTLADLLEPGRHLETGLTIAGVELADVMRTFGGPPLEGRVDAHFPAVSLTGDAFVVEGGGTVDLFGGRVTIGDIAGRDLLSRYPKLSFSAVFRDIDLGRLTRTFDVGEMTGTLEGEIAPMELFGTVPVRFRASVRTVEKKGVARTINVKAIKNVAVIGTGGELTVFDRGIQRFFRRYTYDRLGIEMSLENDVFRLKGLERRGDRELFLKGRLPLPIDIVNAQPGRAISFRSMVDRFRAIDFGGVTTGAPPPAAGHAP